MSDAGLDVPEGWEVVDGQLHRELVFGDFAEAFGFMARVALIAEKLDHHPDWSNSWNRVTIDIVSHDAGRITDRCIELARRIDAVAEPVVSPTPVVEATYTVDAKEVVRSYRACHPVAYGLRCAASALLVVAGFARDDLSGVVLGAAVYLVGEFSVRRQLQAQLAQAGQPRTVTATEDEYVAAGDATSSRPWSAFAGARRTRRFWVLRLNRAIALALPTRALDDEQAAAFDALLRRRGLLR